MNTTMKQISVAFLTLSLVSLAACGRDITADAFQFGGVGDPDTLPPPVPDAGVAFSAIRMRTPIAGVSLGSNDLGFALGIVNKQDSKGLGGPLFTIEPPIPGRQNGSCYYSMGAQALIDDVVEPIDVGRLASLLGTSFTLDREAEACYDPSLTVSERAAAGCNFPETAQDFVSYFAADFGSGMPYDAQLGLLWPTTGPSCVDEAAAGDPNHQCLEEWFEVGEPIFLNNIVAMPPELHGPQIGSTEMVYINGQPLDADLDSNGQPDRVPVADSYEVTWATDTGYAQDVVVSIQFYGSTVTSDPFGNVSAVDLPFITQSGSITCTVGDSGKLSISSEQLDDFARLFFSSPVISGLRGEDANGNGVLDNDINEDLNGNGKLDPITGAIIMVYRYNVGEFEFEKTPGGPKLKGLLKGVALDYSKLDWSWGQPFTTGTAGLTQ